MTTYILAGGNDRKTDPSYGVRLAGVVKRIVKDPVILSCFLSRPEAEQHEHWVDYLPWFRQHFGDEATILEATKDNFYELAQTADVIYLHGGRTKELFEHLPDFEKSKIAFEGKIVIGSSAGANYLSTKCISMSEGFTVVEGSGIIGCPVIVHYRSESFEGKDYSHDDWTQAEASLLADGSKQVICLPEGQFCVIVK